MTNETSKNELIGKYVLIRTYSAGVHVGTLTTHSGREVTLTDARRIWSWQGANTLHEISSLGLDSKNSRVSKPVEFILLTEAIEILPVTSAAADTIAKANWG